MLQAVLFDMDGVLIDSERHYMQGTMNLLAEMGYPTSWEKVLTLLGTTMDRTCELIAEMMHNDYTKEEVRKINDQYFKAHPLDYDNLLKEGVVEMLNYLKSQGVRMAICSSSPLANIEVVVNNCHLSGYFEHIISGEQFHESKPNPEIYLHAIDVMNLKRDECMIIEDSTLGVTAGYRAKIDVIAIADPLFNHDQHLANYQCNSMLEAISIIKDRLSERGNYEGSN